MTGVKSFLIDDLLIEKNMEDKPREKCDTKKTLSEADENSQHHYTQTGKRPSSTSPESLRVEGSRNDGEEESKSQQELEERKGPVPGTLFPFPNGMPLVFPIGSIPNNPVSFIPDVGMRAHSYSSLMAHSFESRLKPNVRHVFGQHSNSNVGMLPTYPPFHPAHFPPSLEYLPYPGFMGHFGVPMGASMRTALHDNQQFANERVHFPLYPMNRTLYTPSCKRKGGQIRFNNSQTGQLEKAFVQQKYLNAGDRKKLAQSLGLTDRQVKTWFQNRRAKLRKCKGGMCAENEVSGSPLDSRGVSPHYDNTRYDNDSPHDSNNGDADQM